MNRISAAPCVACSGGRASTYEILDHLQLRRRPYCETYEADKAESSDARRHVHPDGGPQHCSVSVRL